MGEADVTSMLLVLCMFSLIGGFLAHPRFGYRAWSPAGILLGLLVVLHFARHLHV